jgi:hypothetical protein
MNNPQLSRKEEIQERILELNKMGYKKMFVEKNSLQEKAILEARLDERIRAEQDFLKMIDEFIKKLDFEEDDKRTKRDIRLNRRYIVTPLFDTDLEKLKSTIKQEMKNG